MALLLWESVFKQFCDPIISRDELFVFSKILDLRYMSAHFSPSLILIFYLRTRNIVISTFSRTGLRVIIIK